MRVSVVMPVFNGAGFLTKSLPALVAAAGDEATEIIVVDDASTDESAKIAFDYADKVIRLEKTAGSAEARNRGVAEAAGEICFFVDADVAVKADSIRFVRDFFLENPEFAAVIGSYDDSPAEPDFFSQYRNLIHHYFHQAGHLESETFWTGCGAVKKKVFLEINGYDGKRYARPSVEDIEFGYRMRGKGYRIRLAGEFQAKHLKKWSLVEIVRTDIFFRAVPWSRLLLENTQRRHTLNTDFGQKLSALLTWLMLTTFAAGFFFRPSLLIALGSLSGIIFLNRRLHKFFLKKKGVIFTLGAFLMQILYYVYCSSVFAFCFFEFYFRGKNKTVEG
jgi:glycosyltransferase involved in cell wall biosynthesis